MCDFRLDMVPARPRCALTLIELLVATSIIGILFGLTVGVVVRVREAANRIQCANRMKQLGLALQQYHDDFRMLPPGCSYQDGKDPFPHMSWCTRLLPYLEQRPLWEEAKKAFANEPFFRKNPPHVGNRPIAIFLCPSDSREELAGIAGFTFFLGVEGTDQFAKDGVLYLDSSVRFAEISDGVSNTLMVGERPPGATGTLGWWYAGWGQDKDGSAEMILGAREKATAPRKLKECPADSNRFQNGRLDRECDALHFWSLHPYGAQFVFADGSVHFLMYSANPILPALATRAGNEKVEVPD